MKKVLNNFWIQLFLALIIGIIGAIISYPLMLIFWIKYAGIDFFGIGSSGDKSPITFAIAAVFTILTFIFPTLVWFLLNRFGKLKTANKKARILAFILFVALPLWIYLGWIALSGFLIFYEDYRSVRDTCINKNGANKITIGENTKEFECKGGIFSGFARTYNSKGTLIHERMYKSGKKDGVENVY